VRCRIAHKLPDSRRWHPGDFTVRSAVAVSAADVMADGLRREPPLAVRALRALGVRRIVMVTGDRAAAAAAIGLALRLDMVLADCSPEAKIAAVRAESALAPTAMVGDGVNDAP